MSEMQQAKQKNTLLAFVIAMLLGGIGIHNFYLGRWKRGLTQLFLVLVTFGAALIFTIPFAWFEGLEILLKERKKGSTDNNTNRSDSNILYTEEIKVSAIKEYLIFIVLFTPMLILSIFSLGLPIIIAILFYFLVGGLWNSLTRFFIKLILPLYASVFSAGKKFLIRFSEYSMPPTKTKAELFRANRKLSFTAILLLFFMISLVAQSNTTMVTEGDIPDAVICGDGTIELDGECDDISLVLDCDAECVLENTEAKDRVLHAYSNYQIFTILLFSPILTMLIAPILVLRYSSLSIVDKKTRSMSPLGEKANDLTNVGAGFGALVIFFQTAWRISSSAVEAGDFVSGVKYVITILLITVLFVLFFYPLIWLPMLKFTKAFESHVILLDESLVKSKGIEVHQLTYEDNQLRIMPMKEGEGINIPQNLVEESPIAETTPPPIVSNPPEVPSSAPSLDLVAQNTDENGYEWLEYEGKNYYRLIGSKSPWEEFQN